MEVTVRVMAVLVLMTMPFRYLNAQWSNNSYLNTPVCTAAGSQANSITASDGSGGVIVAWVDDRGGSTIYAQRLDSVGDPKWAINGIEICKDTFFRAQPTIVSDGIGGAIITWADYRNGLDFDIYAQHINKNGALLWAKNGIIICSAQGDQTYPIMVSDGNGGAIFTWNDNRSPGGTKYDIFAQGVNANGTLKWSEVAVCTNDKQQLNPAITSDGSGGAIITWKDTRNITNSGDILTDTSATDIYAQRIGSNGAVKWAADGVGICFARRSQESPAIISDGIGGAIITWQDVRDENNAHPLNGDIYAQRINTNGLVQWSSNGIAICNDTDNQLYQHITSDESGGAIISWVTWSGYGPAATSKISFQRVNSNGIALWKTNGVPMGSGDNQSPVIVSDKAGGAFLVWEKNIGFGGYTDIYAHHISADGLELWRPFGGIVVSNAYGTQSKPHVVPDKSGGIIIAWDDNLTDIYAQHVNADGTLGGGSAVANQTITFNSIPVKSFSEIAFVPVASASSGLPLTFTSSNNSVATISGNTITITGVGTSTITASQAGNASFHEAAPISQLLTVTMGSQFINFLSIPQKTLGDASFTIHASASSNLPVSFTTTSDKVVINNSIVTIVKAGSVTIKAEQAGDLNFNPAAFEIQTFCINPPKPTIAVGGSSASLLLTSSSSSDNQWYKNGLLISGETNPTYNVTGSGIYTVITKADNCSSEASNGANLTITGWEEIHNTSVSVYPNPVDHDLVVDVTSLKSPSFVIVSLLNTSGRILKTITGNGVITMSLDDLKPSIYIIQIIDNGQLLTRKIIKR